MVTQQRVRFLTVFALAVIFATSSLAETVELRRSGQKRCYNTLGKQISCFKTGQDGNWQAGVPWPSPRFKDNSNGTVTDNLTGLTWLKNASCAKGVNITWELALDLVNELNRSGKMNNNDCGETSNNGGHQTDWRLPNINELESLANLGFGAEVCGSSYCSDLGAWLNKYGFTDVQVAYWSSTTNALDSKKAWVFDTSDGEVQGNTPKDSYLAVWPVRGGQSNNSDATYPANVPKTGQIISYAKGDDGDLQRGVLWPSPRLKDNGDGTITDNLTGLMWLKDANCIKTQYPNFDIKSPIGDGAVTWQAALDFVAGINDATYSNCSAGYSDWRLPNRIELRSLIDHSQPSKTAPSNSNALPSENPFVNIERSAYWTSTSALFLWIL